MTGWKIMMYGCQIFVVKIVQLSLFLLTGGDKTMNACYCEMYLAS